MKVLAITVPLFRPNAFCDTYCVRESVGDQFSQAYLILSEGIERKDTFCVDLDGNIPENLLHVVMGEDGRPHAEPYLPAADGKTPYTRSPFHVYVQVKEHKISSDDCFGSEDVFLELWDHLPPGLERPELHPEVKYTVVSRQYIRLTD